MMPVQPRPAYVHIAPRSSPLSHFDVCFSGGSSSFRYVCVLMPRDTSFFSTNRNECRSEFQRLQDMVILAQIDPPSSTYLPCLTLPLITLPSLLTKPLNPVFSIFFSRCGNKHVSSYSSSIGSNCGTNRVLPQSLQPYALINSFVCLLHGQPFLTSEQGSIVMTRWWM
jgi:hypothetical protein